LQEDHQRIDRAAPTSALMVAWRTIESSFGYQRRIKMDGDMSDCRNAILG
jgi:hypothetical protein